MMRSHSGRLAAGGRVAWVAAAISGVVATVSAIWFAFHRQLDIAVYLNAAGHLFDHHLYRLVLPYRPHLPFTYPPFATIVFYPLHLLPERIAQVLWGLVNVAALYAIVHLAVRAVLSARAAKPESQSTKRVILLSLILLAPALWLDPVRQTFSFGQVNLVLAALVLADLTGQLKVAGKTLPQGVLIGLAAAIKLTPLIFVAYLIVTRRVRAAFVAIAVFVAASGLAAALNPAASRAYWAKYAIDAHRAGGAWYISDQSLRAVADRLAHAAVSTTLIALISAVILIGGILLAAWAFHASSDFLGILICATTGLVVSPITWDHHLVWVVPALVWLALGSDRPPFGPLWAACAAILFWWAPLWALPHSHNVELRENAWQFVVGSSFFIAMIVFLTGVAALLFARRRRAQRDGLAGIDSVVAEQSLTSAD